MTRIDPKLYRKHITKDKKGNPICMCSSMSLYGLLRSALLFYKKFKSELEVEAYGPMITVSSTGRPKRAINILLYFMLMTDYHPV